MSPGAAAGPRIAELLIFGFMRTVVGDAGGVALFAWVWLVSPFVVIAVVSHDPRLLSLVAAHHARVRAAGWAGVGMMFLGVALVPAAIGTIMYWFGTPLAGLVVWLRRDDGGHGGDEDPEVPPADWDEFERSFWAYARRGGRTPRRPRTPSAC
jgi:hypothetical protein